jgi:hypothetical protein
VLEVLGHRARADADRARDGQVRPAGRRQLEHLHLPVGELGQTVAGVRRHGATGPLPAAGPPQRGGERLGQDAYQRPVGLGEVRPGPVEGDGRHPAVARWRQREDDLVLDRDMPEELRINPEPVKLLAINKVADLDRTVIARGPEVNEQRMLRQVGLESPEESRVHRSSRIFGVMRWLARPVRDFVVGDGIAADHRGQAGQGELGHTARLVNIRQAVGELRGPAQRVQRNMHV